MASAGFSTREVAQAADVPDERVRGWRRLQLLQPSVSPAQGRGRPVIYSRRDLYQARVLRRVRDHGLAGSRLRRVLTDTRRILGRADASPGLLVVSRYRAFTVPSFTDLIAALVEERDIVTVLDLGELVRDLRAVAPCIHDNQLESRDG